MTYDQVAQLAGYSNASVCRKAILRELDRTVVTNVGELRREELSMLDQLHAAVWPLAVPVSREDDEDDDEEEQEPGRRKKKRTAEVNLFAVDRILAIAERRAKLLGLDTPVKVADHKNVIVIREVPAGLLLQPGAEAGS